MLNLLITIFGLTLFEIITSIDNAVINAHILKTMPEKYRRIFLIWGLLFAVFVIRGVLPFIIVWLANPSFSFGQVLEVAFSSGEAMEKALETSKPLLLVGGGVYLFLIFLSWLFLEEKKYAFFVEHFIHRQAVWFYAISSVALSAIIYFAVKTNPYMALAASIGATAFFITDGFKKNAEEKEKQLANPAVSAWSKIMYLEAIDASFSIDGVIGAFAFTMSVMLILIGNGIGAFVVREITIKGIDIITKFAYLKNGAMYTIGTLGGIMVLESFGRDFPVWLTTLNTVVILSIFLSLSYGELKKAKGLN